jgi:hypothetical protein
MMALTKHVASGTYFVTSATSFVTSATSFVTSGTSFVPSADLGVISPTHFAMLVIMALATTFATSPILELVRRGAHEPGVDRESASA